MTNSNEEKMELVKHIYKLNQDVLQMADTKSSIILGISGIIISILIATEMGDFTSYKQYCLGGAVVFSLLTSLSQLCTIFPRITKRDIKTILFYKGILKYNRKEFAEEIRNTKSNELLNDYIDNIYNLALIQEKKYLWLKIGFFFLILSILLISISFFI